MPSPRKTRARRRQFPWRRVLRFGLRAACWVAIVIGLALGLYLTLRPSSSFDDLWWMPESIRDWSRYNGRLRNLPAFAVLAVPFMILANGRRARRNALAGLAFFVAATEAAQHFIPSRWCEWQDVACGWAGLLVTWAGFEISFRLAWEIRQVMQPKKASARRTPASQSPFPGSESPFPRSNPPFPATLAAPPAKPSDRS